MSEPSAKKRSVHCSYCGQESPASIRFCGICGNLLPMIGMERAADHRGQRESITGPASQAESAGFAPGEVQATALSQSLPPSLCVDRPLVGTNSPIELQSSGLLFLNPDSAPISKGFDHLLEDEPQPLPVRYLSIALLLVLAVAVALRWTSLKQWVADITAGHLELQTAPAPAPAQRPVATSALTPSADPTPSQDSKAGPETSARSGGDKPQGSAAAVVDPATTLGAVPPTHDQASHNDEAGEAKQPSGNDVVGGGPSSAESRSGHLLLSGEKYLYGKGVRRNCQQALVYFRAAAEQGDARALSHLGAMYASGECVPVNLTRAYDSFRRALAQDRSNAYLERNLSMVWREMSPQERSQVMRQTR